MPHELVILSPTRPDLVALITAGSVVDDQLGMRTMFDGGVWQVCRVGDERDDAVLSVSQPLVATSRGEIDRLVPCAARLEVAVPVWWIEASAPWGELGAPGVRIAHKLAALLGGRCVERGGDGDGEGDERGDRGYGRGDAGRDGPIGE